MSPDQKVSVARWGISLRTGSSTISAGTGGTTRRQLEGAILFVQKLNWAESLLDFDFFFHFLNKVRRFSALAQFLGAFVGFAFLVKVEDRDAF